MRIAVTGGAGFIGSHLCAHLLNEGHEILCIDDTYAGSKRNIIPLVQNTNFEFLRHDITLFLSIEVDAIFNLACPASPIIYQKDPIKTIKLSTSGMINMLGIAKRLKIPILQASTSEIYGDSKISPQIEEDWGSVNPIGVHSCYNEGKRVAESLCFAYNRQHNVPIKVVRLFNTYGPGMSLNDGRVISTFIVRALQGKSIQIYGDGSQTRSFCYVDDTVDALIKMMESPTNITGPINIGNPVEITIRKLGEIIFDTIGIPYKFEKHDMRVEDPIRRCPCINKARDILKWEPKVNFLDGISHTVKYFNDILSSNINCWLDMGVVK